MRRHQIWLIMMLCVASMAMAQQRHYLSNLSATKDSPLFTTYAAAMERSEFTLDEGYHLLFYDAARGADFVTDNAGDWCLGFRQGAKYVSAIKDMASAPVITASYPDLVRYQFSPFAGIDVKAAFVVHSSRLAMQDLVITNTGKEKAMIDVLPYLQNTIRAFNDIVPRKERNAMTFTHEEFPDGWVLEHGVPYVDRVHDVFLFSTPMDRMASFLSYTWGSVQIPQQIDLAKQGVFVVWGRMLHKNNERCSHRPPVVQMQAMLNGDRKRLLLENTPRWGSSEANVNAYALYGVELGNFGIVKQGDAFSVAIGCSSAKQMVALTGVVGDTTKGHDVRIDAHMADATGPASPEGVKRDIWGSGTELRLYWKPGTSGVTYSIYRRDYLQSGVYELMAEKLEQTFFTDKNLPDDKIYGYVVVAVDAQGHMSMHSQEVNNIEGSDFLTDVKYPGQVKGDAKNMAHIISASKKMDLAPGASEHLRIIRGVRKGSDSEEELIRQAESLLATRTEDYITANEKLFSAIPEPKGLSADETMMYWTAFSMMRQVMLPPEGKSSYNYYVFSREPQWGWGHGGQVFHESLTMLAYALMDPVSAMNSQRVYRERQWKNGYINYRTGGFLDESVPYEKQVTSSAPWYAWQNWEVYKITKDKNFLEEMYTSSKSFHNYYVANRDSDGNGLCEWGGEAVLESVRDSRVAVWDEVGWPNMFEGPDVNSMLVQEEKSLAAMATELKKMKEAKQWSEMAAARSKKINQFMWDEGTGFYYNIDKHNKTFSHAKPNDLKREEIIGFLPMWAGVATEAQAKRLVEKLTDPKKFWRQYGVPTLAADDPYYNPKGYWNGPVWIQWDYFIERALLQYGYKKEAKEMVSRVAGNMIAELKKDHNLWELYSPDDQWAGYHKTYIWAGLITRMMMEAQ